MRKEKIKALSEYELELREYYIKCLISELSKIIIFCLISIPLGLVKEFLVALLLLMMLRSTGGGLHLNHYLSCLFTSFLFLYGSIFLALYIQPAKIIVCACMIFFAIVAYNLVPVTSKNRPEATDIQIRKCKRNTLIIISFLSILMCACSENIYFYICFWTVSLHIFQLFIAHLRR